MSLSPGSCFGISLLIVLKFVHLYLSSYIIMDLDIHQCSNSRAEGCTNIHSRWHSRVDFCLEKDFQHHGGNMNSAGRRFLLSVSNYPHLSVDTLLLKVIVFLFSNVIFLREQTDFFIDLCYKIQNSQTQCVLLNWLYLSLMFLFISILKIYNLFVKWHLFLPLL